MLELSVFLFGIMIAIVPIASYQFKRIYAHYIKEFQDKETLYSEVLSNLNSLHNKAMTRYESINQRLTKLESESAVLKYGKRNETLYK